VSASRILSEEYSFRARRPGDVVVLAFSSFPSRLLLGVRGAGRYGDRARPVCALFETDSPVAP
jgi:hypothetical protein